MKLIVITTPEFMNGEETVINRLFEAGLESLHLRKPESGENEMRSFIEKINPEFYDRITLHEHFRLADLYGIGGIHLNRRNHDIPSGYKGRISESCHSIDEIKAKKGQRDYLFLSPIYDSISKKGYESGFTKEKLTEALKNGIIDNSVIALGGVTSENIHELKELGFGGAAVLGYLWNKPSGTVTDEYVRTLKSLLKECV